MNPQMPIWLFVIMLLIFSVIILVSIIYFFKMNNYKKMIILKNEKLLESKKIKLRWYQHWGPVLLFLFAIIAGMGVLAMFGLFLG